MIVKSGAELLLFFIAQIFNFVLLFVDGIDCFEGLKCF